MEERAWVNTLSNEEFVKWGIKFFRTDWDDASVVMSFKEIRESAVKLLSEPHETTADEDFAEIGFKPHNAGVTKAHWFQRESRDYVSIYETTIGYDGIFTDEEIDQIRKIADKKRKEMGWK